MTKRWEHRIPDGPGPRGSHMSAVADMNSDGVDEIVWGERVIEVDSGTMQACGDCSKGHIDMGWIAHFPPDGRPVAMGIRIGSKKAGPDGTRRGDVEEFLYDALTGKPIPVKYPVYNSLPGIGTAMEYMNSFARTKTGRSYWMPPPARLWPGCRARSPQHRSCWTRLANSADVRKRRLHADLCRSSGQSNGNGEETLRKPTI